MKVKDLKFDRNLIPELNRSNKAFSMIEASIISQYKHVEPNVVICDEQEVYCPKAGQIKKQDPPIHFFWLDNEENEAPAVLRVAKRSTANDCNPSDWNFYTCDDVELTIVIEKTIKTFGEIAEKWIVSRYYISKK